MIRNARHRLTFTLTAMRGILAVFLGVVVVQILSLSTNKLVRFMGLFPSGDPGAALVYRSIYIVIGSYIAARLAPSSAMQYALVLGVIEFMIVIFSIYFLLPMQYFGTGWYYYGLAVTALPCAWVGGIVQRKLHP